MTGGRSLAVVALLVVGGASCSSDGSITMSESVATTTTTVAPTTTRYVAPTTTIKTLHQELTVFFVDPELVRANDTMTKAATPFSSVETLAYAALLDEKRATLSPDASQLVGRYAASLRGVVDSKTNPYDAAGNLIPIEQLLDRQQAALDENSAALNALVAAKNG